MCIVSVALLRTATTCSGKGCADATNSGKGCAAATHSGKGCAAVAHHCFGHEKGKCAIITLLVGLKFNSANTLQMIGAACGSLQEAGIVAVFQTNA
jgi:hypothetical protein